MREHALDDFVAERFLQMNVTGRDDVGDGLAHKVVVDDFAQIILAWSIVLEGHIQVDIDDDALLPLFFKFMHTDIHVDFKGFEKQAAAMRQVELLDVRRSHY